MTQINLKGLPEAITVGELIEMAKQKENLPEGFVLKFQTPKIQTAEELIEELN